MEKIDGKEVEKEIRAALAALDASIEDLKLRRQSLAALLPNRVKQKPKGWFIDPLTGRKRYYKVGGK